jgi:hypothetical protein
METHHTATDCHEAHARKNIGFQQKTNAHERKAQDEAKRIQEDLILIMILMGDQHRKASSSKH